MRPVVLCLGDSDPSGGDGIQADLKTACALRVYGATVITALTVQNTRGRTAVHPVPAEVVGAQLDAVLADLVVDAIKVGALGSGATAAVVADRLDRLRAERAVPVVLDPELDDRPDDADVLAVLAQRLLPHATVVTPNLTEAGALLGRPAPTDLAGMISAGQALRARGAEAVAVTGGALVATDEAGPGTDVLAGPAGVRTLEADQVGSRHTRGAGDTLATAIACGLVIGYDVTEAVSAAKAYLSGALAAGSAGLVGHGAGPVDHLWRRR